MNECQIMDEDGVTQCACRTDDVLRLLADTRRRKFIAALESCEDGWIQVEPLLRQTIPAGKTSLEAWTREFCHVHLPMLEDHGLIDYDSEDGLIRRYHCELVSDVLAVIDSD
ncbi:DUF7344 domain-containing protein [Natronorubrum thiooxidans]|uniref:DUF7344 domain-containing protein n=1 Tax=Natronorubrum thiooxidans TaxID=308853 RepID=A0A1N7DJE2_9EURY|nr:hypothetical protein [Natronorubrum thiooxidans]SIR75914.1 hypothetical protein SAMN05421752_102296 [Natronorubrum thiooxidans]